ncbi:S1C family serine protease [uncultured Slackia sp.]|uniref:S1C family serine protease n=1 Tax=uncultured Slackia sp. TaxID=665903 RepID=UPI0025DC0D83|nr:trypsin-like peptidase domain-containing protein [uncultured Slackia sp.]
MTEENKNIQSTGMPHADTTQQDSGAQAAQPAQPAQQDAAAHPQHFFATSGQESAQPQAPYATQQIPAQPTGAYNAQQAAQAQRAAQQAYQQQVYQQYAQHAQAQHAKQPKEKEPGSHDAAKRFGVSFAGAALAVVLGLGGFAGWQAISGGNDSGSSATSGANTTIQVQGEDATLSEAVADKVLPSIVSIDIYQNASSQSQSMFGFEMPGQGDDSTLTQTSLGSGVVVSSDGYIITNNHVVEGADAIKATVNGTEYDAELVGSDPSSDIAVIKVDATGLTAVEIGSSSDLEVGEWVMALGSPFGLENSVSTGVVSALQRSSTMQDEMTGQTVIYPNMIQTDATINPGNSGGALVDSEGKLIGINSMIQSTSGSSSGVGFAIPIDYAMGIAEQIMNGETPTHAQLGVSMTEITPEMAQYYNLPVDSGVYVANVYADSAADAAGIKKGDIITKFDGQDVTSASDLQLMVRSKNPGDTVEVVVNRDGQDQTLSVTMGDDEDTLGTTENNSDAYGYGNGYGYGYGYGDEQDGYGFPFGF